MNCMFPVKPSFLWVCVGNSLGCFLVFCPDKCKKRGCFSVFCLVWWRVPCSEPEFWFLWCCSGRSGQQGELQQHQPAECQHLSTHVQQQCGALQETHAVTGQRLVPLTSRWTCTNPSVLFRSPPEPIEALYTSLVGSCDLQHQIL